MSTVFKYVNDGTMAVCCLELDPRAAHQSAAYPLTAKKGVLVRFRAFFRPEASGEDGAGMSEMGVSISDFHDAQSVDCRLECTAFDRRANRIHKSVCEKWTFERRTNESWIVRVSRRKLHGAAKLGRIYAEFRVEFVPRDQREQEAEDDLSTNISPTTTFEFPVANVLEGHPFSFEPWRSPLVPAFAPPIAFCPPSSMLPPSGEPSSLIAASGVTYLMTVPDVNQTIKKVQQLHTFEEIQFILRYFPPKEHSGADTANFELVVIKMPLNSSILLRLRWGLQRTDGQLAFEHTATHQFTNCGCGGRCTCPHKKLKTPYFVPFDQLRSHADFHGVRLAVEISRYDPRTVLRNAQCGTAHNTPPAPRPVPVAEDTYRAPPPLVMSAASSQSSRTRESPVAASAPSSKDREKLSSPNVRSGLQPERQRRKPARTSSHRPNGAGEHSLSFRGQRRSLPLFGRPADGRSEFSYKPCTLNTRRCEKGAQQFFAL
ncbi:hypothetical protein M3Y99_00822000 [Aphelenchoides fujianensis]|nr:hypothetical protein M3Y99_00822000 [Aphelenchoides fujianensis]